MEGVIERFILNSMRSTTKVDLLEHMRKARNELGFDGFAYGGLGLPTSNWCYPSLPPLLHVEYPIEWVNRYAERNYLTIDPVVRRAPTEVSEFAWSDLRHLSKSEGVVMGECREAGLCEGITIPIHGPRGSVHVISFSGRQPTRPDPFVRTCLRLIATHFHARFQDITGVQHDWQPTFTSREHEVLLWSARGKSAWDVSVILGISEHTVRFHLKNVMQKLGTGSKMVAVVTAIRLGLIDP